MKTTEIIQHLEIAFKSIEGHLKHIPIKEFNRLKKYNRYLQYNALGVFIGTTSASYGGTFTVKMNDMKNKGDIKRYIQLIKEEYELEILREAV